MAKMVDIWKEGNVLRTFSGMNKKHHKVLGRSDSVSLGRSEVFCECIYYCVWTCDCQVTVNVDALAPNMNVAHGTQ
jgi:hypothetical protein